uniref:Secreted protein n=1 Tax=Steinernema glaseri TaxID=37863 RepID=A0A1I7Y9W6_9BILA
MRYGVFILSGRVCRAFSWEHKATECLDVENSALIALCRGTGERSQHHIMDGTTVSRTTKAQIIVHSSDNDISECSMDDKSRNQSVRSLIRWAYCRR